MIPPDYTAFFSVMAGVGATLFGLIFVAVSIRPESSLGVHTPIMGQVQVASSYTALLNPLVISLLALIPHSTIGQATVIMSGIALMSMLLMTRSLLIGIVSWGDGLRRGVFSLGSFIIFGFELDYGIR